MAYEFNKPKLSDTRLFEVSMGDGIEESSDVAKGNIERAIGGPGNPNLRDLRIKLDVIGDSFIPSELTKEKYETIVNECLRERGLSLGDEAEPRPASPPRGQQPTTPNRTPTPPRRTPSPLASRAPSPARAPSPFRGNKGPELGR